MSLNRNTNKQVVIINKLARKICAQDSGRENIFRVARMEANEIRGYSKKVVGVLRLNLCNPHQLTSSLLIDGVCSFVGFL